MSQIPEVDDATRRTRASPRHRAPNRNTIPNRRTTMLARMQKSLKEKDQGFTLIELLVVIVIIGILAAIAIPIFLNQQKKGGDAGVKSDLKQLANLEETYYVDNAAYTGAANLAAVKTAFTDFNGTSGNDFKIVLGASGGYCITGWNPNGSYDGTGTPAKVVYYDSVNGGLSTTNATGGAC